MRQVPRAPAPHLARQHPPPLLSVEEGPLAIQPPGNRPPRSGQTSASHTTGSWLTGKPSRACGRPSTGRTPAPRESSTRSGCPPSCPAGLKIGSLRPTSWRRAAGLRSPTGTLRTRRGRHQSPIQERRRRSRPTGRGSIRCSLGKLLRGWPGCAPTQRAPKEDLCGPRRRELQERGGRPSSRRRASTPPSSTSSGTTRGSRSKVSWTSTGSKSRTASPRTSSRRRARGRPCTQCTGPADGPHRLWPGQGLRHAQVRPHPRGPRSGGLRLHPGRQYLHRGLRQSKKLPARRPLRTKSSTTGSGLEELWKHLSLK